MNNLEVGNILKGVGLLLGVIASLLLITRHPILIGTEIVGAAIFFVGRYISKQ